MTAQLDAILGEGNFQRAKAPEPSLLPLLTRFASLSRVLLAARQAELCATAPRSPVPAVARATAIVIARRAKKLDQNTLYKAAASLPLIATLVPLSPVPEAGPELTARIGTRLGDAALVERAIASAFGLDELARARAAGLPLVGTAAELLAKVLDDLPSISVKALSAVAARLDNEPNGRLLESWLHSGRDPAEVVAGIVEMLPTLSEHRREEAARSALSYIKIGALESVPGWIVSYFVRRLRETEQGAIALELQRLAQSLASPWREVVGRQGRLEHVDDDAALRGSHPFAAEVAGPMLRAETDGAIDRLAEVWGAFQPQVQYRIDEGTEEESYLNALVAEMHGDVEVVRTDAFLRGCKHRVWVFLAPRKLAMGIAADQPIPLDLSEPHHLYVSFFAPWLPATPPKPILKPSAGASTRASVEFILPALLDRVELTVVVIERVGEELVPVQSGVIEGDVVDVGVIGPGILFRIDPHPVRPPEPSTDGVTIVVSDDTLAIYGAPGANGSFRAPGELKALRAQLGDQVFAVWGAVSNAKDSEKLAGSLVELAASGSRVLELLEKRLDADAETRRRLFRTDETVRLWSRDLDTDLPVEFIYDGPVPDYKCPSLCAHFFEALKDAGCKKCEQRGGAVCAFDFWGFRRRIERRVADDRDAASGNPVAQTAGKAVLSAIAPAAFGASVNVAAASREAIIAVLRAGGVEIEAPAKDWETWKARLKKGPHRLLVLLSHTERGTALEIGGDTVDRQWITEDYVNPQREQPGPVVLLTGCETARPEYAFLSFVSRFLDKGAAVVVGTLALIREDASAEATQQLLNALRDVVSQEPDLALRTVGEVMRRTRCRLLANRDVTGLNLVAYGDADWRFELVDRQ